MLGEEEEVAVFVTTKKNSKMMKAPSKPKAETLG